MNRIMRSENNVLLDRPPLKTKTKKKCTLRRNPGRSNNIIYRNVFITITVFLIDYYCFRTKTYKIDILNNYVTIENTIPSDIHFDYYNYSRRV